MIAIDPNQPDPSVARPFGLDDGAEPRLAGYAVHPAPGETIDDVVALLMGAGHDPGPVTTMSRLKPDGEEISWRLTRSMAGPAPSGIPFAIDWGDTPSPAPSLPSMGHLIELRVHHPDPATRAVAQALGLGLTVAEGPARLTAVVDTPSGRVEIA